MSALTVKATSEEPFYFRVGDDRLFGFLHKPLGRVAGAIVLCHAFAEEKLWSHRIYVTFAREMAQAGYGVLRFDMRGEGDSARDFEETSVETRVEDTLSAISTAAERFSAEHPVVLVGHRFGGSIAAAAAATAGKQVGGLVVWDPVLDGADYFSGLLRSNMATQMATSGKVTRTRELLVQAILAGEVVVADGYGLGADMYRGMSAMQWSTRSDWFAHRTLVLAVPKGGETEPPAALLSLAASHPKLRVQLATEPPFWRETRQFHRRAANFTAATAEWLRGADS
jgi:pimeloyl-ACP methyl ester carboxylesterase